MYDVLWRFMSKEQRDGNCHKMSQVVGKCRKLSWRLSQIVVTFFFPSPSRRPLLVFAEFQSRLENFNLDRRFQSRSKFSIPRCFYSRGPPGVTEKGSIENFNPRSIARNFSIPEGRDRIFSIPGPSGFGAPWPKVCHPFFLVVPSNLLTLALPFQEAAKDHFWHDHFESFGAIFKK